MTVTVSRTDELISGYKVEVIHGGCHPHLSVRLDVAALLPMCAAFFHEKQLAVSAGVPAAVAEDLMTDRVMVEQGLMDAAQLEEKWSMEDMSAIRDQYVDAAVGESWDANPAATPQDPLIAATESAVIIAAPEAEGQEDTDPAAALAATAAALAAAAAVGELPVDDDMIAATESDAIQLAPESTDDLPAAAPLAAAVAAVTNTEPDDDMIDANGDTPEDDEDDDVDDDIIAANDEAAPSDADISKSPAAPSATAAAAVTPRLNDKTSTVLTSLSSAAQFSPGTNSSSSSSTMKCPPHPVSTKFVSAGPSVASVDLHSPLQDINRAVVEFDARGVEPVDPIHVNQGLALPGAHTAATTTTTTASSSSSTEGGAQAAGQQEQATVPDVKTMTDGGSVGVRMRGDAPLSLPGPPEVAAVTGAAAAAGFDTQTQTPDDQGLLGPREVMEEQQTGHQPSSSSGGDLDALAAAVAAAASVHYACQSSAAEGLTDARAGVSDSPAAAAASVLHAGEAEHKKVKQQQQSHKKPKGLWKWILGKKDH